MRNWKSSYSGMFVRSLLTTTCAIAVMFAGCDSTKQATEKTSNSETTENGSSKLPKLSLHRPSTCDEAVSRMKELVAGIAADGPLPEPLKYRVREVIHGSGASAHSHYYRIDENGKQIDEEDDDGHEHMESSEKQHEIEVDPFTELIDIAQWLPHIAADADIDEPTWNEVKATSKEIVDVLRQVDGESSEQKKRETFRTSRSSFDSWIDKLENCLGVKTQNSESGKAE